MKPVAIIGNYPTKDKAPFNNSEIDIWAFNGAGTSFPRVSALFQMHREEDNFAEARSHLKWLKENTTIPVYMQKKYDYPMCIPYPFEGVYRLTDNILQGSIGLEKIKYFTSSPALAVALAIYQERPRIEIYGIEMNDGETYSQQRDCFTFWIGLAGGMGIKIDIHCADDIFRKELYHEQKVY